MREQRSAALVVVERGEPVPEIVVVLGQPRLPGLVPLVDGLGRGAVLQAGRLSGEVGVRTEISRQPLDDAKR